MSDRRDLHAEALTSDTYHRVRGLELAAIALAGLTGPLGRPLGPVGAREALAGHGLDAADNALETSDPDTLDSLCNADVSFDARLFEAATVVAHARDVLRLDVDHPMEAVFLVAVLLGPARDVLARSE